MMCLSCGEETKNPKFCSLACSSRFNRLSQLIGPKFVERIPKKCPSCLNDFLVKEKTQLYCSRSCSAKINNLGVRRHGETPGECAYCATKLEASSRKFCSRACNSAYTREQTLETLENGTFVGSAQTLRRHIINLRGHCCENCGLSTWMNTPIPLDLDHTDGNSSNNILTNIRLLCLNCHGLTPTYKSKNKGNGRHKRLERYKAGKSY